MTAQDFKRSEAQHVGCASFELLYRHHHLWLLGVMRKRFGDDHAEDLVQETYVRALRYQGEEFCNPRALLLQIATRAAIDHARRRAVRLPTVTDCGVEPHEATGQAEVVALKQVILALPTPLREVFLLSRFSSLTHAQIASHLGVSVKTVEWRMGKALRCCAELLA